MPRAYSTTQVAPEKSRAQIDKMLRDLKVREINWHEREDTSTLRFSWAMADGAVLTVRLVVKVKLPTLPRNQRRRSSAQFQAAIDKERRRMFRMLLHYLKNCLEAVASGLVTAIDVFLPYIENDAGSTVSEVLVPRLKLFQARQLLALPEATP